MELSNLKVGDIAGVTVDTVYGNARLYCKNPVYPVKVTAVGRRWIAVECKDCPYLNGRYERDTGIGDEQNDGARLYASYAEALMESRKAFMRREIMSSLPGKLDLLSYTQIFEIYEILTENKVFINSDIIEA